MTGQMMMMEEVNGRMSVYSIDGWMHTVNGERFTLVVVYFYAADDDEVI